MKNNFGTNISWTLFGESHGPAIGITLDGLPAGFKVDMEQIKSDMDKRKATGKISTQRHEADEVHIISGMYNGYTTGTALTIIIEDCVLDMLILLPLKNTMDIKTIVVADTFPEDLPHAL